MSLPKRRRKRTARQPVQRRSQVSRRAIVDGALLAIKEAGRIEVSMRDIAQRAGVAVSSVYDYFDDRVALLRSVLMRAGEQRVECLERAADAGLSLDLAISAVCLMPPLLPMIPRLQLHALVTASLDRADVEVIDSRAAATLARLGVRDASLRATMARRLVEVSLLDGALESHPDSVVAAVRAILKSEQ
jgi:AcrR family transcriptional regulator